MLLYTPLPIIEEIFRTAIQKRGSYIEIPYSQGAIVAELTSPSTAKIVRLSSCSLNLPQSRSAAGNRNKAEMGR